MLSNKNNNKLLGFTLFTAVKENKYELVKRFLKLGVDPNQYVDADGNTTLHAAVMINSPYMVALLLRYGAIASKKNNKNDSQSMLGEVRPCEYAAKKGYWDCVLAFAYNRKNDKTNGYSVALTLAVDQNLYDVADALLKAGADPNLARMLSGGDYALHIAAQHKNKFMFVLLLHYGANPEAKNFNQQNPYDFATKLHGPDFTASILDTQKISMVNIKFIIFTLLLATRDKSDKTQHFTSLPMEILWMILRYTFNDLSYWMAPERVQNQFYMHSIRAFHCYMEKHSQSGFFTIEKSPLQILARNLNETSRKDCSVSARVEVAKKQIEEHCKSQRDVEMFATDTALLMKFHLFSPEYLQCIMGFCKYLQKQMDTVGEKAMHRDHLQLFDLQQTLLEILGNKNYFRCGKTKMAEVAVKEFLDTHIDLSNYEFEVLKKFNLLTQNTIEEIRKRLVYRANIM